jgi:hypothetical protein
MIRTYCPTCRTPFDVDEGLIGEKGLCPTCSSRFLIARPDSGSSRPDGKTTQPLHAASASSDAVEPAPKSAWGIVLAFLLAAGMGGAFYWVRTRSLPHSLDRWTEFFGNLHPLIIHLPVAIILLIPLLGMFRGRHSNDSAVRVLLWVNFLAAGAGIIAGHFMGLDRDPNGRDMRWHFWSGIATAGCSFLMLFVHQLGARGMFRFAAFLGLAAVTLAGHFGANLTHGDLLEQLPWKPPPAKESGQAQTGGAGSAEAGLPLEEQSVYHAVIAPILAARCDNCHGANPAKKPKGGWKSVTHADLLKAGKSEKPGVVPGDAKKSEAIVRLFLAEDDDDRMPPSDKPQMQPEEIEAFQWWVQSGADAAVKLKDAAAPEPLKSKLQNLAKNPPKPPAAS